MVHGLCNKTLLFHSYKRYIVTVELLKLIDVGFKITNKNNKRKFTLLNSKHLKNTLHYIPVRLTQFTHIKCTSCKTQEKATKSKKTHFPFSVTLLKHISLFHRNVPCRHFPNIAAILFRRFLGFLFYYNKPFPVKHCVFKKNRAISFLFLFVKI